MTRGWTGYEGEEAARLAARYESVRSEEVHRGLIDLLPERSATILDVGAGSGRDAAWLAALGHEVVAVEPSDAMRAEAIRRHPDPRIRWIADALPSLDVVFRLGLTFDAILLSAVWMHVAPAERARAFRKLITLLKPGGLLVLTLREGAPDPGRHMHPVSAEEVVGLAKAHGAVIVREEREADRLGREDVRWTHLALRLPDDGTGALPLLRHVILNDQKSATYKLGLLRAVARVADGAQGMAKPADDDAVSVPLGLIALFWLRLYRPLLDAGLPQAPGNHGPDGLGFVKDGYRRVTSLSPLDLRVGARFAGEMAQALHAALRDAAVTVADMPARYMTWPGTSAPVLRATKGQAGRAPDSVLLDEAYLRRFGEIRVPLHLWRALARYDAWIEPALVAEWTRLMTGYAERQGRVLDPGTVARAMEWSEPSRDVGLARRIALERLDRRPLYCVWTGKRLSERRLDIDHCLPWSAWPCEDLWNLMPADSAVNRNQKRQRLPSAAALIGARDRILEWWDTAYAQADDALAARFFTEASASLPVPCGLAELELGAVFDGVATRRMALRADQQVEEWGPFSLKQHG